MNYNEIRKFKYELLNLIKVVVVIETFACIVLLMVFIVFSIIAVLDMFKIWQMRKREELRRETIKNTLQDICIKLDDISKGIWYEK